ncbi:MAG: hypothetical protein AAFR61_01505 [Bacteroidota bacterium]
MYRHPFFLLASLFFLISLSSCRLAEQLPSVSFRGPVLEGVQTDLEEKALEVRLGLKFLFKNPFNQALPIPEHQFTMKLNGGGFPGNQSQQSAFTVPAKGQKMVTYTFVFDLHPDHELGNLNLLGRDNVYRFETVVNLNLKELGIKLPGALANSPLNQQKLRFDMEDTIRLPLLPVLQASTQPARMQFLGELEEVDLSPIKDGMSPIVNTFLDATYDSRYTDPFVKMLVETKVGNVNVGNYIVNTFLGAEAMDEWIQFKTMMSPGKVNIMNHLIKSFLGNQAYQNWLDFKAQWEAFQEAPLRFSYPGVGVTGLRLEIPLKIYNPNFFPIEAPYLMMGARQNQVYPLKMETLVQGSNQPRLIPPRQSVQMKVAMEVDWVAGSQQLLPWLSGATELMTRLTGQTRMDVGYGPMNLQMDLPLSLRSGWE